MGARALVGAAILVAALSPVRPAAAQDGQVRAHRIPPENSESIRIDGGTLA